MAWKGTATTWVLSSALGSRPDQWVASINDRTGSSITTNPRLPPQIQSLHTIDTIDCKEKILIKGFKQQIMDVVAILIFSGFVIGFCIIAAEDFGWSGMCLINTILIRWPTCTILDYYCNSPTSILVSLQIQWYQDLSFCFTPPASHASHEIIRNKEDL